MARVINTVFTPDLLLHLDIIKEDGSVIHKLFHEDDEVENLRYVKDNKIVTISGRVAGITFDFPNSKLKRHYLSLGKSKSWFKYDVVAKELVIDCSTVRHSDLHTIPVRDILEDKGMTEVDRIEFYLTYGFSGTTEMSDETTNTIEMKEGNEVKDIEYLYNGNEAVISEARVIAITYEKNLQPVMVVLNEDGTLRKINTIQLIKTGGSVKEITTDIASAITLNDYNLLGEGTFSEPIRFSKSTTVKGAKAGIPAAFATTGRNRTTFAGETVLEGPITIDDGVDVVLDGLVLTKDAILNTIGKPNSLTIKNCIITGINATNTRDFLIKTGDGEMLLTIEGCFFGKYRTNEDATNRIYNLFELNCKLKDGSSISGNYFMKGTAANNDICIYGAADNSTITIQGNTWEYSGNAIRIGTKLNPVYRVDVIDNVYKDTIEGDYAGLLLIQPYVKETLSFSNATIAISGTKVPISGTNLFYMYAGKNDRDLNETNVPKVTVNGKEVNPLDAYLDYSPDPSTPVDTTSVSSANDLITKAIAASEPVVLNIASDITMQGEQIVVPVGGDVTVNIPSNVTVKAVSDAITVKAGGKLTLTGDGTIGCTTTNANPVVTADGGEVVLDGLTIDAVGMTNGSNPSAYGIYAKNGGKVTVKSGTIITGLGSCIGSNNTTGVAYVDIQGGDLRNDGSYALYFGGQNYTTITGGKIQGINARMGKITIGGNAEIVPTTINDSNCDPIGSNINTSGCVWLGDTMAFMLGSYTKNAGDENEANLILTIKDDAKVTSNYRAGIGIYQIDTKQNYTATINIEKEDAVTTTAEGFDAITVYDHDYLSEQASSKGKNFAPTVTGTVNISVAGVEKN